MADISKIKLPDNSEYDIKDGSARHICTFDSKVNNLSGKCYKISINSYTNWMLSFTVKLYHGYTAYDLQISGYNYGTNHWYSPAAVVLGASGTSAITVHFGYDSNMHLWVAIPASSYTGLSVYCGANGYYQVANDKDLFTIDLVDGIPETLQTTKTASRPWYRNETVANASKVNNHTVDKDVPSDAVFTDTTYSAGTGLSLSGTTFSNAGATGVKGDSESTYRTGQVNITAENVGAVSKTTYEYNKEISFGSSGKLLIGKFKCYDSNVTIEINSTTATTYHAVAILATQNINTSHGGTITWNVYGDDSGTVASNLYLYYPSDSQWIEIYFSPSSWSKNLIHIQCVGIQAEATNVCESVSAIPETATVQPTNVSRNSYVFKNGDTMTGGLSIDGLTIKRAGIANGTVCNVGWFRIAKIKASSGTSGYPSFIMFYTGTYYNSNPSSCIVSISGNYATAYLNQINGYSNGTFTKIRLVRASSGQYYVDAYQSRNAPTSNLGPQHFTFIGAGDVETYSPTAPLETEETAIAALDIATNSVVSNIVGNIVGDVTGNISGTASNVTGVVSVAHGGTGKTTANDAANNLISGLPAWTANPTDDTYFVRQDTGGTSTFGRVKFSTLWNYIKGKFSGTSPITFSNGAIGINTASTSGYGATKLSTSTSSTATDLAATPSAVKTAYDLANTANGTANSALSGVNGNLIYDHTFTISNGVATFTPHVYQKGSEVTTNYAKSCFTWKYRLIDGSEVALTTKDDRGCDVTITNLGYGGHVIGIFTPA